MSTTIVLNLTSLRSTHQCVFLSFGLQTNAFINSSSFDEMMLCHCALNYLQKLFVSSREKSTEKRDEIEKIQPASKWPTDQTLNTNNSIKKEYLNKQNYIATT